jgi:nicotinate (nicotinamide) nucleotide adenylyltransferase
MRPQIAIFGGSFNPPGIHHRQVVEELVHHFDRVIVVPCGPRPDKQTTNDVDSIYRAALADIAFKDLSKVEVDLFDLEQSVFTTTDQLDQRYSNLGDIYQVVGSDLVEGGKDGNSQIQKNWERGQEMWDNLKFAVVSRGDFKGTREDLPPQSKLITLAHPSTISSTAIRERIFKREPYAHLVTPNVKSYIERYGLYRGRIPSKATHFPLGHSRVLLYWDQRNPKARACAEQLKDFNHPENPECIIAIGGDGTMIRAIRQHWRLRVPFFGINTGHLGFLLNDTSELPETLFPPGDTFVRQLPMLYVSATTSNGTHKEGLAFNDAWVERATSQSAWIQVSVNGKIRMEKMVSDGALISTAAGSTAYARSMGVSPLLADTPGWLIVGSNVMSPAGWKSALLPNDAFVELVSIGGEKRPLEAFVDGQSIGIVTSLRARMSRIATVELAFCSLHDLAEKIAEIQFPKES